MEQNPKVIEFCGEYPSDFILPDIKSDPNFVFQNDPLFDAVKLYDYDKNSVFVNSFIECQHYVTGGWDYKPELRNEEFYLDVFVLVCVFSVTALFFSMKFKSKK